MRLRHVLSKLYSPGAESSFLQTATSMLLKMTEQSPDFNSNLFQSPLADCERYPINIDAAWQHRNQHLTPLFALTQQSQASSTQAQTQGGPMLRQTQASLMFTPTQSTFQPGLAPSQTRDYSQTAFTQTQYTSTQQVRRRALALQGMLS